MSKIVQSYGTGLVLTTVAECEGGGYRWSRRPGPRRGALMRVAPPAVLASAGAVPWKPAGLILPERADGAEVTYRTRQAFAVAGLILGAQSITGECDVEDVAAGTLVETGSTLARLHAVPLPPEDLPRPEGARRLLSWMRGGQGPGVAPELHRRASEILGRKRVSTAQEWCVSVGDGRRSLLHGAPGHGILLPVVQGEDGGLLTGEDLSAGPPEYDVGWLIGELVEFRDAPKQIKSGPLHEIDHDRLIGRVLDGYSGPLDLAAVGRVAALRILTHAHDFAAYVAWHDILLEYLRLVADLVDAAEAEQLLSSAAEGVRR